MQLTARRRQRGLSLVELMVGIVISLIVLAGTIFVFIGNSESSIFHLRSTRFVQQARDAMDLMVRDIRRAGYMGYRQVAVASTLSLDNRFSSYLSSVFPASTLLTGHQCTEGGTPATKDCASITYAYNRDDEYSNISPTSVLSPVVDLSSGTCVVGADQYTNDEMYGFRRGLTDDGIGTVEMRIAGRCNNDIIAQDWVRITDPNVVDVFSLQFRLFEQCAAYIDRDGDKTGTCGTPDPTSDTLSVRDFRVIARQVEIQLSAESIRDPDVVVTLNQVVDIPNDTIRIVE